MAVPDQLVTAAVDLDGLYASLPRIDCQKKCGSFCGPIAMGPQEWDRVVARVGREPSAQTLMRDLRCPFATPKGTCSVYDVRPLICRLWGTVKDAMECPHGCVPERWLTTDEAWTLLRSSGVTVPRT